MGDVLSNDKNSNILHKIDRYSRITLKVILMLFIAIIIVQTLLQVNSIRHKIVPTERYEGHAKEPS